ncbi:protein phosphatase 2A regulatory subunit PR55, partial [Kipferlia bialata]
SMGQYMLTANDKTVKLWRCHTQVERSVINLNFPAGNPPTASIKEVKTPRVVPGEAHVVPRLCTAFRNASTYHINGVNPLYDQENFIVSDDLCVNL